MQVKLSDNDVIVPIQHVEHALVLLDRILQRTPWHIVEDFIGDRDDLLELRDAINQAYETACERQPAEIL